MAASQGLFLVVSIVILTGSRPVILSELNDPVWLDTLDQLIETLMECHQIPGLTLAITHGGENLTRGYGVTSYESYGQAVDKDTSFAIGSLTKSMTSALLAKIFAEDQRGYGWDTPLFSMLCPRLVLSNDVRTMQTTTRDLLAHKMGVPGYFGGNLGNFEVNVSRQEFSSRLQHMDHNLPFRELFSYNNNFYILAGYVAEQLRDGTDWEQLITEQLFVPLGMDSTTFIGQAPYLDNMARPHVRVNGTLVEDGITVLSDQWYAGPAGAVLSSASDMVKWLNFHLQDGLNEEDEQVVPSEWLLETRAPQIELPRTIVGIENLTHYCLGLDYGTYRGVERWRHSGGMNPTYISHQTLHPDIDLGIFTSTSGSHDVWSTYASTLLHFFIEDTLIFNDTWIPENIIDVLCPEELPGDWPDFIQNVRYTNTREPRVSDTISKAELPSDDTSDSLDLSQYVGKYGHPAFGNITISYNDSDDNLYLNYGYVTGYLVQGEKEDLFYLQLTGVHWSLTGVEGIIGGWMQGFRTEFSRTRLNGPYDLLVSEFIEPRYQVPFVKGTELPDMRDIPCLDV